MAGLIVKLLLIVSAVTFLANALPKQDISTFVTNVQLGNINPVTEKKILNAFVRKNPNLPDALRDTKEGTKCMHISVTYKDGRAIIDVYGYCTDYTGFVEVYFNGGKPFNSNNVINLSQTNQFIRIQRGINPTDSQIIEAFLSANNNLSDKANHLRAALKVRRLRSYSASLYADPPQATIIGNSVVSW